ncbi:GNAT family N-acetyltransferase [Paraburkholderia sp. DHOC27]|uniref:GNAT family N-acetyltransferase n=1 Tax=Paraburkholderia sp. DHOC27 TaxID=2303330 RepID=UPI000E3C6C37|nr:GNAT family N-acetyltransferase [Paraburkholderia sp. DHOC27]RFU48135.1 GNAT family N-acetyltransferase [Paraburkholderia sp. DHOC27]
MNITTTASSESVTLRALRVADAEQLHALEQQAAMLHGNPVEPYRTLTETRAWLEKIAAPDLAIAAVAGDILVGFGVLRAGKARRAHTARLALGVHEQWHRQGIGRALMAELLDLTDNWLGLRRVELNVFTDNEPAIALYRACGFEVEVLQRGAVLRDGVLIDCYLMARLREPMPYAALATPATLAT